MSEVDKSGANKCSTERTWDKTPDRVWVARNTHGDLLIYPRMPEHRQALEYMRVLSRQEVDKLANDTEGCATLQWINSLLRTVEGQRKHIAELNRRLQEHGDRSDD